MSSSFAGDGKFAAASTGPLSCDHQRARRASHGRKPSGPIPSRIGPEQHQDDRRTRHADRRFQGRGHDRGASLLILLALGGQAQAAKSTKTVNATATLTSLVNQTKNLPKQAASKTAKAKLLRAARAAKAARSRPCTALTQLAAYRKTLRATKIRPTAKGTKNKAKLRAKLAALGPAALKASRKLLSDRRAKSCGGGVIPSTLPRPSRRSSRPTRTA